MASDNSDKVLRIFCVSIFWMCIGIVQLPMFYPLVAMEKGISGIFIGLILALRPLTGIFFTPIINRYILSMSVELTIFMAGMVYALCFIAFAFASMIDNPATFMTFSFATQLFVGVAQAAMQIGQQCLLLRYSDRENRERNLGMFRVASGAGGIISPLMGAGMYAAGGFFLCFSTLGFGQLLIQPFIYWSLSSAHTQWVAETESNQRLQNELRLAREGNAARSTESDDEEAALLTN